MEHVFPGFGYMMYPPTEMGATVGQCKVAVGILSEEDRERWAEAYMPPGKLSALIVSAEI